MRNPVTLWARHVTLLRAAQQGISGQVAMHVCKAHDVRLDRGVLGCQPSALVAVVGVGPEGRRVSILHAHHKFPLQSRDLRHSSTKESWTSTFIH